MFLGENFIEEDISAVVQHFGAPGCPAHARIFLTRVPNPQQMGVAELCTPDGQPITGGSGFENETLRVRRLVEKPREPVSDFALVGIYLFDEHIFTAIDAIRPSPRGELEITDAIQCLIERGFSVRPHVVTGYWIDTGQMQDMLDANRTILSRARRSISPGASIDPQSQVYGDVVLEDNVRLINSVVRGPSAIGRNVTLTNRYIGPFTAIAQDSIIISSEIEHSIVLEGCHISNIERRIEDSLIGRHTEIYPSSTKPRAYKLLLGDHSRIGVL